MHEGSQWGLHLLRGPEQAVRTTIQGEGRTVVDPLGIWSSLSLEKA